MLKYQPDTFSSSSISSHRLRKRDLRIFPLSPYYTAVSSTQENTIINNSYHEPLIMSPARALLNTTKYDLGENGTHYTNTT